jgi:IS5 family transposase
MVRRRDTQLTLSQIVLFGIVLPRPEDLMDSTLQRMDRVLDDDPLVDQVVALLRRRWPQSSCRGRYGTPAETVLRMLTLKHLKDWSYEQLQWEVTGNLVYRRFCRIDGGKVPDATTLVRLAQWLDAATLRGLFDRVVAMAVERKVTRGRSLRVDTTVVEAPIHHPTDSGLCQDVVRVLSRAMRSLVDSGVDLPFRLRHVGRSVSRRLREIGQALRLRGAKARQAIQRPYRRLLRVTARVVRHAQRALQVTRRHRRPDVARVRARLERMVPLATRVVRQTRARILRGQTRTEGKLVSLFEPYAQILRRGKPHRPTEFGMLVKVQEAEGGIVTDVALVPEKADAPLLVPSVERHLKIFGRAPRRAATDRGFYSTEGERRIRELGVHHAVIPKPGFRSKERIAYEQKRWFRRGRAWRTGGEARISRLKRVFGMARSRYRGEIGMQRTVFWAAIANNLVAIGRAT